jgi:CRISPR/Cas system-associated exonuclease Cas4 (RecB family)
MILSYSRLKAYLQCPKAYEYGYVKKLEKNVFNENFFVGNVIHEGLHLAYMRDEDLFVKLAGFFDDELERQRNLTMISPEQEQKLVEWKIIISGMIYAYCFKNGYFIGQHEHMHNEKEYIIDISSGVQFLIKTDNIIKNSAGRVFVHEIKTTRQLNEQYVSAIQNSLQVACYYHLGRKVPEFMPAGIIYDVLQKPTIRVKKTEDYQEYLDRLNDYYQEEPDKRLYMEIINEPRITHDDLIQTIESVASGISDEMFHKSFMNCNQCDYPRLCYNNDAPEHMIMFRTKEKR